MMETNQTQSAFKGLKIIYTAMFFGQIVLLGILFFLVYISSEKGIENKNIDKILQVAVLAIAAIGFFVGTSSFKNKLIAIRSENSTASEKFSKYTGASIMLWACIEGPIIFGLIVFYITHNYAILVLAVVMLICFGLLAPAQKKLIVQLNITEEEAANL